MKILEVRFENINSLYGKWRIDFTHPDFIQDGIFAITGPTGAGKSTILDAICLALYGCTPRLNKVNQSSNEMMSRKTGHCMAEVLFETKAGRFRCQWAQHRARQSAAGSLQAPKHELSNAISGKILSSKLKEVLQQVEAITGMNFDRFTRSMLLAQGKFASFLQANADERSPILEQITGTEIYSQISKEAHIIHANEKKKLGLLEAVLNGVVILSVEDEAQLVSEYQAQEQQSQQLKEQEEVCLRDITWLKNVAHLTQELGHHQNKQKDTLHKWQSMQPERNKLQAAEQALELSAQYNTLKTLRKNLQSDSLQELKLKQQAPKCQASQFESLAKEKELFQSLKNEKQMQKGYAPIWKQVHTLDTQISEQKKQLKQEQVNAEKAHTDVSASTTRVSDLSSQKNTIATHINGLEGFLQANENDDSLHEQLSGIQQQCSIWMEQEDQRLTSQKEVHKNEKKNIKCDEAYQAIEKKWQEQQAQEKILKQDIDAHQKHWGTVLKHQSLSAWHKKKDAILQQQTSLKAIISSADIAKQAHIKKEALQISLKQLETKRDDVSQQSLNMEITLRESQLELNRWQQQRDALKAIQSYEKARSQLEDAHECPLCGALEHPFATGNIPALDEAEKHWQALQKQHQHYQDKWMGFKEKCASIQRDCVHQQQEIHTSASQWEECISEVSAYFQQKNIPMPHDDVLAFLQTKLQSIQQALQSTQDILQQAETLEAQQQARQTQWHKQVEQCHQLESQHTQARINQQHGQQKQERLKGELKAFELKLKSLKDTLSQYFAFYGIQHWSMEQLPSIQKDLQQRSEARLTQQRQFTEATQELIRLTASLEAEQHALAKQKTQLAIQEQAVTSWQQKLTDLKQARFTRFEARDPDAEESKLAIRIQHIEETHEQARQVSVQAKHAHEHLQKSLAELNTKIQATQTSIEESIGHFQDVLKQHGFDDESALCHALLPQHERQSLKDKITALEQQKNNIQADVIRLTQELHTQQNLQYTQQTPDALKDSLQEIQAQATQALKAMGAMKQQLHEQQTRKQEQQVQLEKIEAQKHELARWSSLNELIGSGDGKKFRNFAQGLTFELVVQYANQQLCHMSDRYILQRDQQQALDLNIVDLYQAGEVRSIKNISGGESFLVSLALSLGLSQMSSKKVKIDSLFLDEGFGTLDHESLETAIETLASLQQDGKLIGIISHVDSIKERIATQIQVHALSEGKSAITGSGCCAI